MCFFFLCFLNISSFFLIIFYQHYLFENIEEHNSGKYNGYVSVCDFCYYCYYFFSVFRIHGDDNNNNNNNNKIMLDVQYYIAIHKTEYIYINVHWQWQWNTRYLHNGSILSLLYPMSQLERYEIAERKQ